jgi:predicted nucleic acid-binding protein
MDACLDTSVIVALAIEDLFTERAQKLPANPRAGCSYQRLRRAEFASVIARRVRTNELTLEEARLALGRFDQWKRGFAQWIEAAPTDIAAATVFIRTFALTLRAPDALNLAIVHRLGLALATFDLSMATNAAHLGIIIAPA